MSDLISKSALLDSLIYCKGLGRMSLEAVMKTIEEQSVTDEKEILRKPMERIVERLEEVSHEYITEPSDLGFTTKGRRVYLKDAIEIVKEEGGVCEYT